MFLLRIESTNIKNDPISLDFTTNQERASFVFELSIHPVALAHANWSAFPGKNAAE